MKVTDLNRSQLEQLKSDYLIMLADRGERAEPSWGEILNADDIVPDDVIFTEYADTEFVEEDFFSK